MTQPPNPTLTERWQNVYKGGFIHGFYVSQEIADLNANDTRTHYLKTVWNEQGVLQEGLCEWIKIENS